MTAVDDASGQAIGHAGPMDGAPLGEDGPDEYEVVMADGSRHPYERSRLIDRTDGGAVYNWAGRI